MASDALPIEQLRNYLSELKPAARSLLVDELERGLLRAEEVPGTELVLNELRRSMRESHQGGSRIGTPARLFFRPFEPFLVDDRPDHPHRSRIARVCLERMWIWISRDIIPAEAKTYADDVSQALLSENWQSAEGLTRAFQDRAAAALAQALAEIRGDAKAVGRLSVQLGSNRALTDLECAVTILRNRNAFEVLSAKLPAQIRAFTDPQLGQIRTTLESPLLRYPELLAYGLVLVMDRLAAPWELVRLAVRAADCDVCSRIAATPYAVAVDIVLDEVERMVKELRTELKSGQGVAVIALLKGIHDAARGLRTEIDLSVESSWGRQLAGIRGEVSRLVRDEVESMPARVRQLLRPRPASEVAPGQVLDDQDVAATETLIGFVDACRHFAGELAINEMTLRSFTEVQNYLDNGRQALLDGLRNAGDRERAYRQSQVDAAVRFCAKIFGRDYASVLAKAADVAAGPERKAARQ